MDRQYDKAKMGKLMCVLFLLFAAAYLLLLFFVNQRIERVDVSGCDKDGADRMEYQIEKIDVVYGYVQIRGYAYEPGASIDTADTRILAYDPVGDAYYRLPTEHVKKEKITEKAGDGFNYDYAQFRAVARAGKLPGGCRVCIWYCCNGANRLIHTDEVIFY